jgi:hypothetical protein
VSRVIVGQVKTDKVDATIFVVTVAADYLLWVWLLARRRTRCISATGDRRWCVSAS